MRGSSLAKLIDCGRQLGRKLTEEELRQIIPGRNEFTNEQRHVGEAEKMMAHFEVLVDDEQKKNMRLAVS